MTALLSHPAALLNTIRRLAVEAGNILMDHYDPSGYLGADIKVDGSPVTAADHAAENHILHALNERFANIPIIGEETVHKARYSIGDLADFFWLIDPLDGTRAFVAGERDFTVNIALIHRGTPILGVIYAPAYEDLYAAHRDVGAYRAVGEDGADKTLTLRRVPKGGATVVISQTRAYGPAFDRYMDRLKIEKKIKRSSSLKLCMIAAGKADLYPGFGETSQWDTAAGQAILETAGGYLVDHTGSPVRYGLTPDHWINPDFLAAADPLFIDALRDNDL